MAQEIEKVVECLRKTSLCSLLEHDDTKIKKFHIDGANLDLVLTLLDREGMKLPATGIVIVGTSPYDHDSMATCDPRFFENVQTLALMARPAGDIPKKQAIPSRLVNWLKTLPVKFISFNRDGYDDNALRLLNNDPELRDKIIIIDSPDRIPIPASGIPSFSSN